ncbi:MAG: aminopeptidase P family protein [Anaerolineaceae bacterium]|jgi:Xaa-Pro aminopeptidase|nr:MAG: aminopeptidase P family protein [Anaerolineaceae bacterium]
MKKDLDQFMKEQQIDALWVSGAAQNNPDMVYFTGIHHVSSADLIKVRGQEPVLFYNSMEREEAAKTGLRTIGYDEKYPLRKYMQISNGNTLQAVALRYKDIFTDFGIQNKKIAIAGKTELNAAYAVISAVQELLPKAKFAGYFMDSILKMARLTKSADEVERIRKMGMITTSVVGNVADFLSSCTAKQNILMDDNGTPVTIGTVKAMIRKWLAEKGADNPEDTIFSIGRDAGVPHNSGEDQSLLELGKTIVFDIFPCEAGGGYFYDFTRTWCLGYAPDEIQKIYQDVFTVHQKMVQSFKPNTPFRAYQTDTCRMFRECGYLTIEDDPDTLEGYVHSLGHGLGLDVHESPFSGIGSGPRDILEPGMVFTVEPGLYYPSRGLGVRIEDTVYLNEQGNVEILAEFPYQLILPVKG